MLEVLASAENAEAVIASVQSGADAVIIRFGGSGAHGFTEDGLKKSVRYCRVRGCRVYAQLDTLVADSEAAAAAALARRACELGVDALIAQDLGFIPMTKAVAPEVPIFAGERLGLHNTAGIEAVRQLGVTRVFVPRELSLDEIRSLAGRTGVELAVSVAGEQCPARAGQCWLSALNGSGSANRGNCSRVCESRYSLGGRMDDFPLSTKPALLLSRLAELEAAGVRCAVIGDTDRPEQLARLVGICSVCTREGRVPTPLELDELNTLFAGREFTDAYLDGKAEDAAGVPFEPERDDLRASERAMGLVRRGYGSRELRRVRVEFFFAAKPNMPLLAGIKDTDGNHVQWKGPVVNSAPGEEISESSVSGELQRTKGTPYHCDRVMAFVPRGCVVPPGTVIEARRALIHALTAKRAEVPARATGALSAPSGADIPSESLAVCVEVKSASQLSDELAALKADYLYLPLTEIAEAAPMLERFADNGTAIAAVLPRVIHDSELAAVGQLLQRARAVGVTQALVGNLGHIALTRMAGMEARGDYGLNIFNSYAVAAAAGAGLLSVTASFELKLEQIRALSKPIDVEMIAYGRLPAMLTERCIIKASARRCVCTGGMKLSDSYGHVMPVMREYVCRNAIYSSDKVYMADRRAELQRAGVSRMRLLFTNEGARECVEVTKSCMGQSSYRPNGLTRGFYVKGVD